MLHVSTAQAATSDSATATASPGPHLVGQPITFTSTNPCTVACRLIWTYLNGTRLGVALGEGTSVTTSLSTHGLKTVELSLTETCVGTTRLVCSSVAVVSVDVQQAPPPPTTDSTAPAFALSGVEAEATGPTTPVLAVQARLDVGGTPVAWCEETVYEAVFVQDGRPARRRPLRIAA